MEKNPLVNKDRTLKPWDKICEYAYEGIESYVEKTSSAEELQELRDYAADVRWLCEEEFAKADRQEEFGELDSGLEDVFATKEQSFRTRKKN